jgi:hypothetical protein
MPEVDGSQRQVCERFGVLPVAAPDHLKLGMSRNVRGARTPIHGMRHPPEGDTTGWYIWSGELSTAPDFFQPLHVAHLREICPNVLPYLALPPGWRFLVADDYEDVWRDDSLLAV